MSVQQRKMIEAMDLFEAGAGPYNEKFCLACHAVQVRTYEDLHPYDKSRELYFRELERVLPWADEEVLTSFWGDQWEGPRWEYK